MNTRDKMERVVQKWLVKQFEFENCGECGRDEHDHTVVGVVGNFFALCTPWHVGLHRETKRLASFCTEEDAVKYVGTLPDALTGKYYIDGPTDDA